MSGSTSLAAARKLARRVRRLADDPGATLDRVRARVRPVVLSHHDALHENGFTVYRGLFSEQECADIAVRFKAEAGIDGSTKFMKVDVVNHFETARWALFEGRILQAVRTAVGGSARFLQVGDLHYLHDTAGWHRDSVHRAPDASSAPDWRDDATNPFGVVKAILYMEADNAAMGIMAGSHLSPHDMDFGAVKRTEKAGGQLVIGPDAEPNRRLGDHEKTVPLAWQAQIGDVLVFDERMFHAGRRVEGGRVVANRQAPKFTLSMVFGTDNHHSERMYSYFRYARRELHYRDLSADVRAELGARDLVLDQGWTNFYEREPEELRHVYLRDPENLDALIAQFGAAGRARGQAG